MTKESKSKIKAGTDLLKRTFSGKVPPDDFDTKKLPPPTNNSQSNSAKGICVVLEDDLEKHKIESLLEAIKQLKHVLDAEFLDYGFDDHVNRIRVKTELKKQLKDILT